MSPDAAHTEGWQIGEVVFGIPLLVAIALQLTVPIRFPRVGLALIFVLGGVVFIVVGLVLIVLTRREFAEHDQPTDPGLPTGHIITTGVFSISRNPLYLGAVCFLIGVALAVNLPWILVLLFPALVACHYVLIVPEERYLARKFGEEYRRYAATVHRWIGRARLSR